MANDVHNWLVWVYWNVAEDLAETDTSKTLAKKGGD